MFELAVIVGSIGLFAAGFASWYTLWHRRLSSSFERVPVRTGRSAYILRDDVALDHPRPGGRVH